MPIMAAVREQVRQEGRDAVDHAADHHAEPPVPIVVTRLLDRSADAHAGVVDEQVHLAERAQRFDGGAGVSRAIRDIEPERQHIGLVAGLGEMRGGAQQVILAHVGDDDLHAGAHQDLAETEADAVGTAGDECDLALNRIHTCTCRNC
jgi:hypothetical protein